MVYCSNKEQTEKFIEILDSQPSTVFVKIMNWYWKETKDTVKIFPNTEKCINKIFHDYTAHDILVLAEDSYGNYFTLDPWAMLSSSLVSAKEPKDLVYKYKDELKRIAEGYQHKKFSPEFLDYIHTILETDNLE